MKTPITYYGGKQALLKHLLPLVPAHRIYCEPFFGGGALFFAKPKAEVEIINDLNSEVVNFFKVTQTKFAELEKEIKSSLHSRELYKRAMVIYQHPEMFDDVKRAWAFWVATNQGFSSLIGSWGFGKTNSKEMAVAGKRESFTREFATRLKQVQVENNDALKVIDRADSKETFFYIDPPYIGSDQGHYKGYTEEDYKKLLDKLSKVKGKFLLSSYPSKLLNSYIHKNKWKVKKVHKSVAVTKLTEKRKTEMIVMNYDPTKIETMKKVKSKGLSGTGKKYDALKEIQLIERFLTFRDKMIRKNTIKMFIDDLQKAILEKKIRKHSPYAKQIVRLQEVAIKFYKRSDQVNRVTLSEELLNDLYSAILDYENKISTPEKIDPIDSVELSGVDEKKEEGNVLCSTEFTQLEFKTLGFTDKWFDLIGDPAPGFTAMVFGKPKMGKSYLCVDFAGYLARNFGKVLYVAKEEKLDATLQKKLKDKDVAHVNLFVSDSLPADLSTYDFIFLDSVNLLGLSPKELRELKAKYPGKGFIYVFQTTKAGNFRGANSFQHDVDVVIEVPEKGKAVQYGRFNQGGEINIF